MLITALEEALAMARGTGSREAVARALIEAACSAGMGQLADDTANTVAGVAYSGRLHLVLEARTREYLLRQKAEAADATVPADLTFADDYRRVWRALCR